MKRHDVRRAMALAVTGLLLAACGGSAGDLKVQRRSVDPEAETAAVATISRGARVDLADHLAPQGLTIFEFTATW